MTKRFALNSAFVALVIALSALDGCTNGQIFPAAGHITLHERIPMADDPATIPLSA